MPTCDAPITDEALLDYWAGDGEIEAIEAHLFECEECTARLAQMSSIGTGIAALTRRGRVSGIVSRALINRMQRDGVHLRQYVLSPGETVPCAAFPGDDLVVASLRADFSGVQSVALSVLGPNNSPIAEFENVPVSLSETELSWALPGGVVQQMPSVRLELTLRSADEASAVLGDYVLEHSGPDQT